MTDEYFMKLALKEAQLAYEEGEVPVGAIVVMGGKLVARGHNMVEKLNDPTAHAETQQKVENVSLVFLATLHRKY